MSETFAELPPTVVTAERLADTDADALALYVGGKRFHGWDSVSVVRGCERMPSEFALSMTERFPGENAEVAVDPGAPCVVKIGADTVLTGHIDRVSPQLDGKRHLVQAFGRSKCADLVDCSAVFERHQMSGQTVKAIAAKLCEPYGITVSAPKGEGPTVPQLNMQFGESPFDLIERLCRFAGFLAYDDADGNLVLSPVGAERHSSGVREGANLLAAVPTFGCDLRFTEYRAVNLSTSALQQPAEAGGFLPVSQPLATARDTNATHAPSRQRVKYIIVEHSGHGDINDLAKRRAEWEAARRAGRSEDIKVVVDSWRDSSGRLWEPNRRCKVHVPTCKVIEQEWIIAEAQFRRGANGTDALLTLMPPRAFDPQYEPLYFFNYQIQRALDNAPAIRSTPSDAEGPGK